MKRLPETSTMPPYTGTVIVRDHGMPLGSFAGLDFVGAGVAAFATGSFARVDIPGGGGGGGAGIFALDDGVPLGTGTSLDFGNSLIASISGSRIRVDATPAPVTV